MYLTECSEHLDNFMTKYVQIYHIFIMWLTRIINISTYAVFEPEKSFPTSGVMRASLSSFTKFYSDKYAKYNIRMNNIFPGFIDSLKPKKEFIKRVPLKRAGKVGEISSIVSLLAAEDCTYITGQNIRVDGGITRSV